MLSRNKKEKRQVRNNLLLTYLFRAFYGSYPVSAFVDTVLCVADIIQPSFCPGFYSRSLMELSKPPFWMMF